MMRLAALVGTLDYLITSDSLALHLAVAKSVPFLAFFAPTSAAEIDVGDFGTKLVSTAPDYASYLANADNRSITSERILDLAARHRPDLFSFGNSNLTLVSIGERQAWLARRSPRIEASM